MCLTVLSPAERGALRARAHRLHPVVLIGDGGLTDAVLLEIDRNLAAHGLIKIRVADAGRDDRNRILELVCEKLEAAPVQHIGRILVVFRPRPEGEAARPLRPRRPPKRPPRQTKRSFQNR
jgi:putative YhbY family RNA-binding protein